jgi:two-component SAPR family response regulator
MLSPIDILCRELYRLNNDIDRLQMIVTLKSHLNNLKFNFNNLQFFFSSFNDEYYRLQAINLLIPSVKQLFGFHL